MCRKFSFILTFLFLSIIPASNTQGVFQTQLFSLLSKSKPNSNIVFSPLSIYQALSLLSNGARGKTQQEIITCLNHIDQIETNLLNVNILKIARQTLVLANAVLSRFTPSQQFIHMSHKFKAFTGELISVEQVNKWCSEKTNGLINKIINDISNVELLILIAVYFKGKWEKMFKSQDTYVTDFHNKDNSIIQTNMMKQINTFNYYEDENVQIIEMLYKDDDLSAIIILPQLNHTVDEFINEMLFPNIMDNYLNKMEYNEVEIHLPKFSFESDYELNDQLKEIGIKNAFDKDNADFSIISPHQGLYVSKVIHKAFIRVDEEGTEAAAVTAVIMTKSMPIVRKADKKMIVNRPFIFIIRDKIFQKNYPFLSKVTNLEGLNIE